MSGLVSFRIDTSGFTPFGKRWKSTLNAALKHAMMSAARYWHQKMLPLHFGTSAARRYGYEPRKGIPGSGQPWRWKKKNKHGGMTKYRSYSARKFDEKGHVRPLEYTGELKQSTRSFRIAGSKSRGVCYLTRAHTANRRHPNSQIRMSEELTVIRPDELQELHKVAVREVEDALKRARGRERILIR